MRTQLRWAVPLVVAGLLECGMALAHFGLQYEWSGFDFGSLPGQLKWALFALNFSWAVLLLVVGALVIVAGRRIDATSTFTRRFVFAVGLFWFVHAFYIWTTPMPLPPRLAWLGSVLALFPAPLIALHWIPLISTRHALAQRMQP